MYVVCTYSVCTDDILARLNMALVVAMYALGSSLVSARPVICEDQDQGLSAFRTSPCPKGSKEWRGAG